eukprot:CAMPEP_0205851344 /NCGR_PEP_ID=MMETSP1083-20121108/444_1 /ASSEMBLY_ACC=CAM_ASM_000430 /TAXON_ID=97485 /ORGANISM="Prymnesium parvum, Strain Texoma1" /LENGTH=87 /DNA_ID=CAMNT_0053212491 /DNA_START=367 /DNA_END=626 /DNA_ORIENTATION=+
MISADSPSNSFAPCRPKNLSGCHRKSACFSRSRCTSCESPARIPVTEQPLGGHGISSSRHEPSSAASNRANAASHAAKRRACSAGAT